MAIKNLILALFLTLIIPLSYPSQVFPENRQSVRESNWEGIFYPANSDNLTSTIECFTAKVESTIPILEEGDLRALILPHGEYKFSGLTSAYSSIVLSGNNYEKIILIGPDHHLNVIYGAVSSYKNYLTPLGKIPVHPDAARLISGSSLFRKADLPLDKREHSLEVPLPFLQYYLDSFQLVPIILGPGDVSQLSRTLREFISPKTLIVISSDFSHHLSCDEAKTKDKETINNILDLEGSKLEPGLNQACGLYPLKLLIKMAADLNWKPQLIHYSNSGDSAGNKERVVGYATIAFFDQTAKKKRNSHGK